MGPIVTPEAELAAAPLGAIAGGAGASTTGPRDIWKIIAASAGGTMIEWYDFYIFGSLGTIIAPLFYPKGHDVIALDACSSRRPTAVRSTKIPRRRKRSPR